MVLNTDFCIFKDFFLLVGSQGKEKGPGEQTVSQHRGRHQGWRRQFVRCYHTPHASCEYLKHLFIQMYSIYRS